MMAASHIALGAASFGISAHLAGVQAPPEAFAIAALGALLPDIDHPHSWAGRRFKWISIPLAAVIGHRGLTHSLLAVIAGLAGLAMLGMGHLAAPLVIGYLSHLAADACTPSGVPLLWPMKKRFSLSLVETGSWQEVVLVGGVVVAVGYVIPLPEFRALL